MTSYSPCMAGDSSIYHGYILRGRLSRLVTSVSSNQASDAGCGMSSTGVVVFKPPFEYHEIKKDVLLTLDVL